MGVLSDRLKKKDETEENTEPVTFGLKIEPKMPELVKPASPIEVPKSVLGARLFEQEIKRAQIPTYYQQYKKVNQVTPSPVQFSIKTDFNIQTGLNDLVKKKSEPEVEKKLTGIWGGNNLVTKFLIGKGTRPEDMGKDRGYFLDKLPERGLLGFFTGDLLKSDHETAAELYEVFVRNGMNADEAFKKANDSVVEGKAIGLDPEQQQAYLTWDKWEKIGTVLDATFLGADVLTMGGSQLLKQGVKSATRRGMAEALKTAAKTDERTAIRDVLLKQYPTIKGSEELEKAIDVVLETPDDFSWLKIRNEFRNSEVFKDLAKTEVPTSVEGITEAQKALFRTGTPTLKTLAGDVDEIVDVRKSLNAVLRGEREADRLLQPDILASEIKAGSLPRNATADDTVEVFRIGGSGRKNGLSDQLTLSKDLVEEGAESFRVPIKDLVRLEDGTFARVPVEQIGKDLTPSIKAVRDIVKREKVIAIEEADKLRVQMEQAAQKQAQKKAEQEVIEREARDEAIRLDNEAKLVKAREVVESAKSVGKGSLTKMKDEADKATRAIGATEKKINKAVQNRTTLLRASTAKAGLTAGRFVQKFGEYMMVSEKLKIKGGKALTTIERARIQKRVREAMDKEITALKVTKDELQSTWRKAGADLVQAKSLLKEADEAKKVLAEVDETVKKTSKKENSKTQTGNKTETGNTQKRVRLGTIDVEETSILGSAVRESELFEKTLDFDKSELAEQLTRKGTTLKEQAELSTKYLVEKGIDDALESVIDGSRLSDEYKDLFPEYLLKVIEDTLRETGQTAEYFDKLRQAFSTVAETVGEAGQIMRVTQETMKNSPFRFLVEAEKTLASTKGVTKEIINSTKVEIREALAKADADVNVRELVDDIISKQICLT